MLLRRLRPSYYLGFLACGWGLVNMGMGFVRTYEGLVVLRFFLGVFEAGVLPGIIYVSSMYYKRHEFQKRMNLLFLAASLMAAFGGLLAYAIAHIGTRNGYSAWRWIFIIEGSATVGLGLVGLLVIADWPEQNRWLTAEDKALLRRRMDEDVKDVCRMDRFNRFSARLVLPAITLETKQSAFPFVK